MTSRLERNLSDMTFSFSAAPTSVPVGTYVATLDAISRSYHEEFGEGVRFSWRIIEGPSAGMLVSRTCGIRPNATNAAGRLMSQVMGRPIAPGETVSLATRVGRTYSIVVGVGGKGGSTRVESCTLV